MKIKTFGYFFAFISIVMPVLFASCESEESSEMHTKFEKTKQYGLTFHEYDLCKRNHNENLDSCLASYEKERTVRREKVISYGITYYDYDLCKRNLNENLDRLNDCLVARAVAKECRDSVNYDSVAVTYDYCFEKCNRTYKAAAVLVTNIDRKEYNERLIKRRDSCDRECGKKITNAVNEILKMCDDVWFYRFFPEARTWSTAAAQEAPDDGYVPD